MTTPKFTDERLAHLAKAPRDGKTDLEMQLANFIIDDRKAFRQLIKEIEPMAKLATSQRDDTFSLQLDLIKARL